MMMNEQKTLETLYKELDAIKKAQIESFKDSIAVYKIIVEQQEKTIKMLMGAIDKMAGNGK